MERERKEVEVDMWPDNEIDWSRSSASRDITGIGRG